MSMNYTAEQVSALPTLHFAYLRVAEADHVLRIRLDRPAKRNAMNPLMMAEISFAMAYAHYTASVWLVVLEAEGQVWSAGADLKAFSGDAQPDEGSTIPAPTGEVLMGELFVAVHKPTIAVVDAPVFAGGHLLVGGSTYVVASENATFTLPEVKRGLFPYQVMAVLLQTLPARRVLDWCLRGATLSRDEAAELGLVTHAVAADAVDDTVVGLIQELKQNSPSALRLGLKAFDHLRSLPGDQVHAYLKQMLTETIATADAQEGLAAFKEKRTPNWTGA